jgi:hypothetical protein
MHPRLSSLLHDRHFDLAAAERPDGVQRVVHQDAAPITAMLLGDMGADPVS